MFEDLKNEVVTVVTLHGEYIGRLGAVDNMFVVLKDPRFFQFNDQGAGLSPAIAMSGAPELSKATFVMNNVVTIVPAAQQAEEAWRQNTSGLKLV